MKIESPNYASGDVHLILEDVIGGCGLHGSGKESSEIFDPFL